MTAEVIEERVPFIQTLDERIKKLKDEQSMLGAAYGQMEQKMNSARVRFAQLTGAINELEDMKKSLNGSEPPQ